MATVFQLGTPSINPTHNNLKAEYDLWVKSNPANVNTTLRDYALMKSASTGASIPSGTGVYSGIQGGTTPETNIGTDIYNRDLKNLEMNKKYLIDNAIGQAVLNTANLSNAFAQRPNMVGIGNIPNVQYPNVTAPMISDLNASLGKYRSGIGRYAAEKGLSPDVRIGAEANLLNSEIAGRGKISEAQNTQDIANITANSAINQANIEKQYAAKIADTARMDQSTAIRSGLFSQGLTNLGKIGTDVTKGLSTINNQKNTLGAVNYYVQQYQKAKAAGQDTTLIDNLFKGLGYKDTEQFILTNNLLTNTDIAGKTVKD